MCSLLASGDIDFATLGMTSVSLPIGSVSPRECRPSIDTSTRTSKSESGPGKGPRPSKSFKASGDSTVRFKNG